MQTLLDDLQRKLPAIIQAKDGVKNMLDAQPNENAEDCKYWYSFMLYLSFLFGFCNTLFSPHSLVFI